MRTFRLLVAYDGTGFHGWQVQPGLRTVQGTLEEAVHGIVGGEPFRVSGAGRTDVGVHARGQVASFKAETGLPGHALAPLLNRRLPRDVRVRSASEAGPAFHARHSARGRRYAYRIVETDDVLLERYAWNVHRAPDWAKVEQATRVLEGEQDFSAFAASGSAVGSNVCRVRRARWRMQRGGARLDIISDHFLYHMVRNVVSTVLRAARDRDPAATLRDILASRSRARAAGTAPAHGLCLEQVEYPVEEQP